LHCRQEARVAASDRRKKLLLRGSAAAIIVAVIAVGMSNAAALRGRTLSKVTPAQDSAAAAKADVVSSAAIDSILPRTGTASPTPAAATVTPPATATLPPAARANTAPSAPPSPVSPIVRVGDTPLGNGVVATRSDSGILVGFDTPDLRTRDSEKFERFLRRTLPQIYGTSIEAKLASIPLGKIVGQGNLLYELPTRGIRFPVQPGWHLEVYPEIRPGNDGPLVVRYRSSIVKD
jgi:hypothetical protein